MSSQLNGTATKAIRDVKIEQTTNLINRYDVDMLSYQEHGLEFSRSIALRGATNPDGSPAVTIDAQQQGRVFLLEGGGTSPPGPPGLMVLENLVITGGDGGIRIRGCRPIIRNCIITQNESGIPPGGGVLASNSGKGAPWNQTHPKFIDCVISGNSARDNAGVYISDDGYGQGCQATLANCIVTENTPRLGDVGGVHNAGIGSVTLIDTIVCGNEGEQVFGAVELAGDARPRQLARRQGPDRHRRDRHPPPDARDSPAGRTACGFGP